MIAILGANGFIGRHAARALLGQDLKLFARQFDDFPYALPASVKSFEFDFSYLRSYIQDLDGCRVAIILVHASFVRDPTVQQDTDAYKEFFNALIKLKKPPEHIIYLSSGAVYGKTAAQPTPETYPVSPLSAYGHSKADIEKVIVEVAKTKAFRYSILRVANPVGIWCKRKALLSNIIDAAHGGPPLKILGDGSMVRDYFDVRELAQAIVLIAQKHGENKIYNVGRGKGLTINEVVAIAEEVICKKIPKEFISANNLDVPYSVLDCTEIKKAISWEAKIELKDIIKTMWNTK